jgi:hypothetical protein
MATSPASGIHRARRGNSRTRPMASGVAR